MTVCMYFVSADKGKIFKGKNFDFAEDMISLSVTLASASDFVCKYSFEIAEAGNYLMSF